MITVLSLIAVGLYVLAGALLWYRLSHTEGSGTIGYSKPFINVVVMLGLIFHGVALYHSLLQDQGLNLAFTTTASLVAWVAVLLLFITSLRKPVENLGIAVFPLAGLTIIVEMIWPGTHFLLFQASPLQTAHILVSLVTYSLLFIAAVQSVLLFIQERHLHQHHPGGFIRALPPMQTMEHLMFQMIAIGFVLLTLTMVSGVLFSEAIFGKPLQFTHKTLLSIAAWIVFAVLLLGHWRLGWRGRTAIGWTLGGFSLLALAYFGSKFVLEILLNN